jgi:hypothetical protein
MPQVMCPRCHTKLTISDSAPRLLTCPRCVSQLINPYAGDPAAQTAPRRVIPVEQQVSRDQSLSRGGLAAMMVLLTIGGIMMISRMGLGMVGQLLTLFLLAAAAGGLIFIGLRSKADALANLTQNLSSQTSSQPPPIPPPLTYRTYQQESDGRIGLRFAGGFFTSIGVCAACFVLLGVTVDFQPKPAHIIFLGIALTAVVGLILLSVSMHRKADWRGFGPGVTVGLVLGMMALGPCGFCYLMTFG